LRHGAVGRLWWASALNSGSTWLAQIGLFLFVLRHASTHDLALVELAGSLPALLCLPVAGALADRTGPRRLALLSLAGQAVFVSGMAALPAAGSGALWPIASCYAAQGLTASLWGPARQRWLYALVSPADRAGANAAIGSVSGLMTIVGAALGGVLAAPGPVWPLIAAAGAQWLSTVPLLRSPRALTASSDPAPSRRSLRADLVEGVTALRHLPLARSIILIGIGWGFIGGGYDVMLAGYATHLRGGGGLTLGTLYLTDGIAVIIGTALARRLPSERHLSAYTLAFLVQGAAWSALFLAPSLAGGVALLAVMRVASGVIIALDTTILLAQVPDRLRGRVTSVHLTTYNGVGRLSLAVFSVLLAMTSLPVLGVATGCGSVLAGLAWWLLRDRGAHATYASRLTAPLAQE
jgi:hypothetical protein